MRVRKVELAGKRSLTHKEAVALNEAITLGYREMTTRSFEYDQATRHLVKAWDKLRDALEAAGGFDASGAMKDPFKERR